MMNDIRDKERDRVLMAFHDECEKPSVEQILDWIERFPKYADDIRAHAAVARDLAEGTEGTDDEVSQTVLDTAYSNALNAIYLAKKKNESAKTAASFHDIAAARNIDVVDMADEIDIARGVLADLFDGAMLRPIRNRLIDAVCQFLSITGQAFDTALDVALTHPRFGHAKATDAPIIRARPCDEIIRDSPMSPERKRYWLEEV
jgi:DNA-binding Xre family transcriptional regulator